MVRRGFAANIVVLATFVLGDVVYAQGSPATLGEKTVVVPNCVIEYDEVSVLGAGQLGAIRDCYVRVGDRVKTGQVLVRLRNQDIEAELEVAKTTAANVLNIKSAELKYEQAKLTLENNFVLRSRISGVVPTLQFNIQKLDTQIAKNDIELSKFTQTVAIKERAHLEAQLILKQILAPHDGIVTEVYKKPMEAVVANDPILKVVNTDKYRINAYVDISHLWMITKGQEIRVTPDIPGVELPIENESFSGRIVLVEGDIDPKTRTVHVVGEVQDRKGLLRSGLEARMEISLATQAPAAPNPTDAPGTTDPVK